MCFVLSCFFFFFKQKTAYEIGVRLVGSQMCIRDSECPLPSYSAPHHTVRLITRHTSSDSTSLQEAKRGKTRVMFSSTLVARSSTETPRRWARKRYVSTTWAGVLGRPRNGSGAR